MIQFRARSLAVAAGLALLLSAPAALAGSNSLSIRANAVAEAGQLIVSLETENRGDESAHGARFQLPSLDKHSIGARTP